MQINIDKTAAVLLGIIAGLLAIIVVLMVDKVQDDGHMIEPHGQRIVQGTQARQIGLPVRCHVPQPTAQA